QPDGAANLMPSEYSTRYRQQFVDRLWGKALMTALMVYVAGVVIYFAALQVLKFQANKMDEQLASIGGSYTNAIQIKERYRIMKERQDLKYAALDSWKTTAELLPQGATLESLDFRDGAKLALRGTAPTGSAVEVDKFNEAMRKAKNNEGQ